MTILYVNLVTILYINLVTGKFTRVRTFFFFLGSDRFIEILQK